MEQARAPVCKMALEGWMIVGYFIFSKWIIIQGREMWICSLEVLGAVTALFR